MGQSESKPAGSVPICGRVWPMLGCRRDVVDGVMPAPRDLEQFVQLVGGVVGPEPEKARGGAQGVAAPPSGGRCGYLPDRVGADVGEAL